METFKTTFLGYKIDIIYFANTYYFSSSCGLICIANICNDISFLTIGNKKHAGEHLTDDKILTSVKRFLKKHDPRFNENNFIQDFKDLSNFQLIIKVEEIENLL